MDFEIKTDNVPEQNDSQNNHENSLGENDNDTTNAYNDLTSIDDTTTENENHTSISTNSFGGSEFIRNRRLRTPVWARCSIKILFFLFSTPTLSLFLFYLNLSAFPFT